MYQEEFMRRAIEISATALETDGREPFGAVVVKDGQVVGEGINQSLLNHDPTSHGETEAIRDACRRMRTVDLRGCELYTSCEPCALCVAAMEIARISGLYYAADLGQAGRALAMLPKAARFPVDSDPLREECGKTIGGRYMPSRQALADDAIQIIQAWAKWRGAGP